MNASNVQPVFYTVRRMMQSYAKAYTSCTDANSRYMMQEPLNNSELVINAKKV